MVSQCWNSNSLFCLSSKTHHFYRSRNSYTPPKINCLHLSLEDIAGIAHNKVLIAAGVSAAVGQLSKPFTSVILYGKDFDPKVAVQAGGFPSTHSSAVVASAISLALERGFSDSIFGLSVVYAGLVMYDSQGVRREVGNHARVLNKLVNKKKQVNSVDNSQLETSSSSKERRAYANELPNTTNVTPFLSESRTTQSAQLLISPSTEEPENSLDSFNPLKESIGHTEVEVIAGAFLGFFVSLAVYATL
ncbi:Acid phosphatase/vanadium-dependent haloperoxidase-related protein [Euphorbia peplus]|nr:Acid phosphatase/vanadium-dependent haloperoxidase-related protein [Euphorbia peplus]